MFVQINDAIELEVRRINMHKKNFPEQPIMVPAWFGFELGLKDKIKLQEN